MALPWTPPRPRAAPRSRAGHGTGGDSVRKLRRQRVLTCTCWALAPNFHFSRESTARRRNVRSPKPLLSDQLFLTARIGYKTNAVLNWVSTA